MRRWLVLIAAAALTACGDVVVVNDPVHHPNYVLGDELYAARNGAIRVEVAGDTFGLPQDRFARGVVELMRESYYRPAMFTGDASPANDPRYKIVMMFNPHPSVSGEALCAAPQPFQPVPLAPGERARLLAAFCGGSRALSETQGWVRVSGPQDPNFAELVKRVTNSLFPRTDSRRDSNIRF